MCVPCTSLSQRAEYAQNEQYVNGTEAEGGTCATRCIDGFYRDQTDQYCKRCWTAQELILAAGPGFFTVLPCTDTLNTQLDQCLEKAGSTITGHDLEMRGDCPRVCSQGWRPLINASGSFCEQCPWPFDVEGGTVHTTAFKWHDPDDPCRMHCLLPYRLAADRLTRKSTQDNPSLPTLPSHLDANRTCVLCDGHCPVGEYATGELCTCVPCTNMPPSFFQPPYPEAWEAVDTTDTMIENPVCCDGTTQTCEGDIDPGSVVIINTGTRENSPFMPSYGPRTMRITWSDVHWKITRYTILLIVISTTEATQTWQYSAALLSGPEATLAIGEHNKHKFLPARTFPIALD